MIDTDHEIIVDVEARRFVKTAEVGASRHMIDRTSARFGLKPDWVAADTAYGSAENLAWIAADRQIPPFIPVFDKSKRQDGTRSRSDFTWDPDNDKYPSAKGKELKRTRQYRKDPRNRQPRKDAATPALAR